jgi:trans-2,3-dihydro-3-hydroxyanthranilate isomerase
MFYSYTLAGREKNGTIQGRGIFPEGEDSATGPASGCLVSLLVKQGRFGTGEQILIEQGDQIHRPSRIYGSAAIRGGKVHSVHIGGTQSRSRAASASCDGLSPKQVRERAVTG